MPGLGDALSKSLGDLESIIDQAAAGQEQADEARSEEPSAGLSEGEREALLGDSGPRGAAEQPEARAAEPAPEAATFTSGGVIRRRFRAGGEAKSSAASAPQDDVLAACARIAAVPHSAVYRLPVLTSGLDGLVKVLSEGCAGQSAVLALCGACDRAGTNTVALAAALRLGAEGRRVLLVDADLRSPRLAELLGAAWTGPDLRAVLRGDAQLGQAVVYATAENLAMVVTRAHRGRGREDRQEPPPPRAALGLFLEACRAQFDAVVLDAGSLADWAGTATVAAVAGRAVLVVRAGRVTVRTMGGLKYRLERAGAKLDGAVLTFAQEEV